MAEKQFRVYYMIPTSSGFKKEDVKLFGTMSRANSYALKLVKDLRKNAKETDDDEGVIIENLNNGSIDRAWKNEGEGRVAYYKGGF